MHARCDVQAVHLVESVLLGRSEDVFRMVAAILGHRVRRIPDGETGERANWIRRQGRRRAEMPGLEPVQPDPERYGSRQLFRIGADVRPDELRFGSLGYADAAGSSYRVFARLKSEGVIPHGVRFQVSLPTPVAVVAPYIQPQDAAQLEPAYSTAETPRGAAREAIITR